MILMFKLDLGKNKSSNMQLTEIPIQIHQSQFYFLTQNETEYVHFFEKIVQPQQIHTPQSLSRASGVLMMSKIHKHKQMSLELCNVRLLFYRLCMYIRMCPGVERDLGFVRADLDLCGDRQSLDIMMALDEVIILMEYIQRNLASSILLNHAETVPNIVKYKQSWELIIVYENKLDNYIETQTAE